MRDLSSVNNRSGDDKDFDACGLFGMMNLKGERFSSRDPVKAISNMHDRGNGLGGGFAVYGLYPQYADDYALHIMYLNQSAKAATDQFLRDHFTIVFDEEIPTRDTNMWNPPHMWRYFVQPQKQQLKSAASDDFVLEKVIRINTHIEKAFVFSSGKDMGVFKGVGFPESIADYFCLDEYEGYMWICHGRFPTNTPGWWGGAHPFNILDWTVVHNGELSSYGINRRYLQTYGYRCTMQTDTEVLAYALDWLRRKQQLPLDLVAQILAPPFWSQIDRFDEKQKRLLTTIRQTYGSLLMNGPFAIIVAHHGEMIGLSDRIKLRPLTAGRQGDYLYLSSEESAIRVISPRLDRSWNPRGGELVIGTVGNQSALSVTDVVMKH
ncbi:MAG: glutamine amidotransferase family protein [Candidatus Bathyarchaeota archaeon]|nr:MAG: glutamine amidotransferase family protein [Candidatus Bathyarchaeota archaeon]